MCSRPRFELHQRVTPPHARTLVTDWCVCGVCSSSTGNTAPGHRAGIPRTNIPSQAQWQIGTASLSSLTHACPDACPSTLHSVHGHTHTRAMNKWPSPPSHPLRSHRWGSLQAAGGRTHGTSTTKRARETGRKPPTSPPPHPTHPPRLSPSPRGPRESDPNSADYLEHGRIT
jgi:hypothetical protein